MSRGHSIRSQNTGAVLIGTALLMVTTSLSGCFFFDLFGSYSLVAEWHQPGLFEKFPDGDGEYGDYWIHNETTVGKGATKDGGASDDWSSVGLSVSENGDVRFRYGDRPPSWSSGAAWDHLSKTFEELDLPPPSLNTEFKFAQAVWSDHEIWSQPSIWENFPENGSRSGFDVYIYDSVKIAERIQPSTSEWVRATEDGNVSYRHQTRWIEGSSLPTKDSPDAPDPYEQWSRRVMGEYLPDAFNDLGLPEPQVDTNRESNGYWGFGTDP